MFCYKHDCCFSFRMNPPSASHMSGVWERMNQSFRGILDAILPQHGMQLDDKSFCTYICDIAEILKYCPKVLNTYTMLVIPKR